MHQIKMTLFGCFLLAYCNDSRAQIIIDTTKPTLQEVVVNKKLPKPEQVVNERYVIRGVFSSMVNVKVFDFINHPPPPIGVPIMQYMMGKIPGLKIAISPEGYTLKSTRSNTLMYDEGGILVYLDEQEVDINFLNGVQPKDIALVKYFPPGIAMAKGGNQIGAGVLAFYSRKGPDLFYYEDKQ